MWKSAKPTTFQEFGNYCQKMQIDESITLKDSRYESFSKMVRKMQDGKCYTADNFYYERSCDWDTANAGCPQGWRLPTLYEYENLYNLYGGDNLNSKTNWCIYSLWTSTTSGDSAYKFLLRCAGTMSTSLVRKSTKNDPYNCVANQY